MSGAGGSLFSIQSHCSCPREVVLAGASPDRVTPTAWRCSSWCSYLENEVGHSPASVALRISFWSSHNDSMPDMPAWQDMGQADDMHLMGEDTGQ